MRFHGRNAIIQDLSHILSFLKIASIEKASLKAINYLVPQLNGVDVKIINSQAQLLTNGGIGNQTIVCTNRR